MSFDGIRIYSKHSIVKSLHIRTNILSVYAAHNTVPKYFGSDKVCCLNFNFMWTFNEVSTICVSYSVWVPFLQYVAHNDMGICDLLICGYVFDCIMVHKDKSVYNQCVGCFVAL